MELEIERGIPITPRRLGELAGMSNTLRAMKIGESFWIRFTLHRRTSLHSCGRAIGIKLAIRREDQDGVKGLRVWKLE
jgi:hypothetical protein